MRTKWKQYHPPGGNLPNYKQNTYREKKLFQGHYSENSNNVRKFWLRHTDATLVPSSTWDDLPI